MKADCEEKNLNTTWQEQEQWVNEWTDELRLRQMGNEKA